jgi:small neutral amino acid transporter SnatA (MarC family)
LSVTYALAVNLTSGACDTLSKAQQAASAVCSTPSTTSNPTIHVIHVTADLFGLFTGVVAVIMIIVSGITMITSGGNSEAVGKARKRLINSVIGLIIVALAWTIVIFLTDRLIT